MKKKEKIEYREKIKNTFFDVLKEYGFTVENIEEGNGYFLFEFGETKELSYGRCRSQKSFDDLYNNLKNL